MLIQYPPTIQLSKLVNNLKSATSRRERNEFLDYVVVIQNLFCGHDLILQGRVVVRL